MHYDAQQAVNEDKAKFVDNAIHLTSAQIRDRYGIRQNLIALETVRIRKPRVLIRFLAVFILDVFLANLVVARRAQGNRY